MRAGTHEERRRALRRLIRNRFARAVRPGERLAGDPVQGLGCSVDGLMHYIESLWSPGMTWENHGSWGWHLDHVRPLASFDLTKHLEFAEAAHHRNLLPLWAVDNLRKGHRWSAPRVVTASPVVDDDAALNELLSRSVLDD